MRTMLRAQPFTDNIVEASNFINKVCLAISLATRILLPCLQDGWKKWKRALKQSNELDDNGYEDDAARSAAQMVADAHKKFASKAGKGKKGNGNEAEAEPFSVLHKVSHDAQIESGSCVSRRTKNL